MSMTFDEIIRCLPLMDQKIIRDIMSLFDSIDRQTEEFSGQTGLKCKDGCGSCCENPCIETTIAEVLPLAAHLWSKGMAQHKLEEIRLNATNGVCVFYVHDPINQAGGCCSIYAYRPGLCRLFGFSARKNKYGRRELVTCKIITDSQPQACKRARQEFQKETGEVPLLTAHACYVAGIDPCHGHTFLPINLAVSSGIEKIGYSLEKLKQ
ncbi:MAG: YkgJ family cysteine cluster protein [Candidatus Omnitrophica bacterium]|nr:YkgJ family cysteine cluster protein [Candidatus Omnitrophota bacterium]